jgi:hypothetical protein
MFNARSGDAYTQRERDYLVTASENGEHAELDEYNATLAAANASPASLTSTDGVLLRMNATIRRVVDNSRMVVTVQYGEAGGSGLAVPPSGTVEYEFNYQAPSVHVYQSLETVRIRTGFGEVLDKNYFEGGIGVKTHNGTREVEGVSTTPANTTSVFTFTGFQISSAYEVLVENLMGCVNSVQFKGRPPGSMRFVHCTSASAIGQTKTQIRFGFQYEQNVDTLQIGSIIVPPLNGQPAKRGHDYVWVHHELTEKDNRIFPTPTHVVIERVFRYADLNQLGF